MRRFIYLNIINGVVIYIFNIVFLKLEFSHILIAFILGMIASIYPCIKDSEKLLRKYIPPFSVSILIMSLDRTFISIPTDRRAIAIASSLIVSVVIMNLERRKIERKNR